MDVIEEYKRVRECLPQFDTFDWARAREAARAMDNKGE